MTIAEEANGIVHGQRREAYGSPLNNHSRTSGLWTVYVESAMKKGSLSAEDVCYMNILQKIARSLEKDKRDNGVDIVGYALNVELIKNERNEGKW